MPLIHIFGKFHPTNKVTQFVDIPASNVYELAFRLQLQYIRHNMAKEAFPHPSNGFDPDFVMRMKEHQERWATVDETPIDYARDGRSAVAPKYREGDTKGIVEASLPAVQMGVVDLALHDQSSQVRLQASQFLLSQAGMGAVQKVEHGVNFRQMPPDQLKAFITSKLAKLQKTVPGFSIQDILTRSQQQLQVGTSEAAVEAEFEDVSEKGMEE